MSIGTVIIIVLLAILAAAGVVIAMSLARISARYDQDVEIEYAELRADLDAQSDLVAKESRYADAL